MVSKHHTPTASYFAAENHMCFDAESRQSGKPPETTSWWRQQISRCPPAPMPSQNPRKPGRPYPRAGGYGSRCHVRNSPLLQLPCLTLQEHPPDPGSSIPSLLPFTFLLLKLCLGRNSPAWILIRRPAELGFAYILEKP